MNRSLLLMALLGLALSQTGCQACRKLFGLDRRCETPPPNYYQAQPVYSGPMNYAPAPACNSPK